MRKISILIAIILLSSYSFGQIRILNPTSSRILNLSISGEKEYNDNFKKCEKIWDKVSKGTKYDDLTFSEKEALKKVDEGKQNYWDVIGEGCSWYCSGGPEKVTASSFLNSQGKSTYQPQNAHDLNYKNAWVEGVEGYGIGEFLLYTFRSYSPRINKIIIANGYVKGETAWKNNSRVKKIKMYVDGKPYAILNLKDIRGEQVFEIEPLGQKASKMNIKFEILDVYKGEKFDDVVISEIYFDGLDVHCFIKGTNITMNNGLIKKIEELQIGDTISHLDKATNEFSPAVIQELEKVIHCNLVTYYFESGRKITVTQDHPFLINNKSWCSLQPEKSKTYKGVDDIKKIKIGDKFQTCDGIDKLTNITELEGSYETYTISKISSGDNFIANGCIVKVEELKTNIMTKNAE